MSTLVLELRSGETLMINGAVIRFRRKTQVELTAKARFVFGKQIMTADQANSPASRIYFALQSAYIGTDQERLVALSTARTLVADFKLATQSRLVCRILDSALAAARVDDGYRSLRLIKLVMRYEDAGPQSMTGCAMAGLRENTHSGGVQHKSLKSSVWARAPHSKDRDVVRRKLIGKIIARVDTIVLLS